MPKNKGLTCLILCLLLKFCNVAVAQTQSDDPPPDEEKLAEPVEETQQEDTAVLQPITVTATRQSRPLTETAANVSVITQEDLERRMDNVLEDVFRYEPGIEISRQTSGTDPFSSSGGIQIRGVGGNRTQVLVDGNRTIERTQDSTRDIVDSSNVKAVEIVRGPSSVLWGSDGLGGVVNFVTKDPSDYLMPGQNYAGAASIHYGSLDNAWTESVTGAFRTSGNTEMLISYTRRDANEIELDNARIGEGAVQPCTRNPEATPCNAFDPLDIASNNLLTKLVWKASEFNQFRLTGEYFDRESDVQQNSILGNSRDFFNNINGFVNSFDRTQEIQRWRLSIDQQWQPDTDLFDSIDWQLTYTPQEVNRFGERNRTLIPSGDEELFLQDQQFSETFFEVDLQLTSSFSLGNTEHLLTYGFDGDRAETDNDRIDITRNLTQGTETIRRAGGFNFADATTDRTDVYVQNEISFLGGRFKFVPGVRVARYSIDPDPDADFQLVDGAEPREITETDTQLKAGAIFDFNDRYSIYAQVAEGFKMPTAEQLFQSLDSLPFFALIPNPDLQPESVLNYEAGLRGDFGATGFFSVNVFYADYENFIQNFVDIEPERFGLPPGTQTLTYDNVDELQVWGIEGSAGFNITDRFSTRISMSWQDGEVEDDERDDTEFLGALPFQTVAGLRYFDANLGLDLELVGTFQAGSAPVNNPETQFAPGSFTVFDFIAGWEVLPDLTLRASIFNLLDRRYFPAEARGLPINGSDASLSLNPIELQTAPGRNFRLGLSYQF